MQSPKQSNAKCGHILLWREDKARPRAQNEPAFTQNLFNLGIPSGYVLSSAKENDRRVDPGHIESSDAKCTRIRLTKFIRKKKRQKKVTAEHPDSDRHGYSP